MTWTKITRGDSTTTLIADLETESGFDLLQEDGYRIIAGTFLANTWKRLTKSVGAAWSKTTKSVGISWNKIS